MTDIKTAIVAANPKKSWSRKLGVQVISFLKQKKVKIAVVASAQLAICIGGDGTLLFNKRHYGKVLFGIGSSHSYICQATKNNWKSRLAKFLKNPKTSQRLVLSSSLNGKKLPAALNDIAIKTSCHRILSLLLGCNFGKGKTKRTNFLADGVVFSTPTGSSAYAYSCGGMDMKADSKAFQIVAIAPYRRAFQPSIVPSAAKCTLKVSSQCATELVLDGQLVLAVKNGSILRVWASKKPVLFAEI